MWNIWSDYWWWLLHFPKPHKIDWIEFFFTLNNFVFHFLFRVIFQVKRNFFKFRPAYAHVAKKYQTDRSVSRCVTASWPPMWSNCFTFSWVDCCCCRRRQCRLLFDFYFLFFVCRSKWICSFVFWVCNYANSHMHLESKYNLFVVPTCLMRILRFRVHNTKTNCTEIFPLDKLNFVSVTLCFLSFLLWFWIWARI